MSFSKWIVATGLILSLVSVSSKAGVIEYSGYSRDDTTNIVSGNGLEWLQWTETLGQSIDSALTSYAPSGWRLATNEEMTELLNSFDLGGSFIGDENISQTINRGLTAGEDDSHNYFTSFFGDTYTAAGGTHPFPDIYESSQAIFGDDSDGDSFYNSFFMHDDFDHHDLGPVGARSILFEDDVSIHDTNVQGGIALVRTIPVPEPGTIPLLLLGLLGLHSARKTIKS